MKFRSSFGLVLLIVLAMMLGADAAARPFANNIARVSITSGGVQGNGLSDRAAVSGDGRFVAYQSDATNLVSGDGNSATDIFVHDRQTGTTERVSMGVAGEANGASRIPAVSADGRYVTFETDASNLIIGDNNGATDIFVRDRQTSVTERVSVGSNGQGNGDSRSPAISADGRFVAFESDASNLVSGDTNNAADIFVRDRQTSVTTRVSVASDGTQADNISMLAGISADGRFVGFSSNASNLDIGDTNGFTDVYVHDRQTAVTEWVSKSTGALPPNGNSYWPTLSADGRYIAFFSDASNLVTGDNNGFFDVFVRDRQTGMTERVSVPGAIGQGNGLSLVGDISDDGRYVTYYSSAFNLVGGDSNGRDDVFLFDRQTQTTTRLSLNAADQQGDGLSWIPAMAGDGTAVAFSSQATNLVAGDSNGVQDIFVVDLGPQGPTAVYLPVILHEYPPTYAISGQVLDNGSPVSGVTLSLNTGAVTTTDANGRYQFSTLPAGTYTITPAKTGYTFIPTSRTVTLPPDAANVDFTAVPNPTPTATPTGTPTPTATATTPPPSCSEWVNNGGFETNDAWQIPANAYPAAYDTAVVHSGGRAMRAGIINPADNRNSYSSFWQWVQIPANAPNATLSFWLYPVSGEPGMGRRPSGWQAPDIRQRTLTEDAQFVLIFDQNGQQHTLLFQRQNDQAWTFQQFDLMQFRGQTFQIYFGAYNDGFSGVTGMYVDDVSLQVCP
ncbi:MAG: carboxypeptidase regulatory-like domain-containing protein [Anaerolineae bacterium]